MKIEEAQELMRRLYLRRDKERGIDRALLRTFQELAELSDSIDKRQSEKSIENEIADVFAWIISIANLLDINLGKALLTKYNHACSRCQKSPCICTDNR